MHHKVIAHQMCAVQMLGWLNKITNYSGLLKLINVHIFVLAKKKDIFKHFKHDNDVLNVFGFELLFLDDQACLV